MLKPHSVIKSILGKGFTNYCKSLFLFLQNMTFLSGKLITKENVTILLPNVNELGLKNFSLDILESVDIQSIKSLRTHHVSKV